MFTVRFIIHIIDIRSLLWPDILFEIRKWFSDFRKIR